MNAGRTRRLTGAAAGVALLAGAVAWALTTQGDAVAQSLTHAGHAPWWLVTVLIALPIINWLTVSLSFSVLTARFGRVGTAEMSALIGAAWLLNYLPLRPGMIGRVAYHKKVNGIRVRDAARVMGENMAMTGIASVCLFAIALATVPLPGEGWRALAAIAPLPVLAGVAAASRGLTRVYAVALAMRWVDMLGWVGRYAAVFALVGEPIGFGGALAIAAVSHVALLVPLSGNGVGLREWLVGLTAGALPAAAGASFEASGAAVGIAADLVNRAAELVVAVPIGLVSAGWVARSGARNARSARSG